MKNRDFTVFMIIRGEKGKCEYGNLVLTEIPADLELRGFLHLSSNAGIDANITCTATLPCSQC